MGGGRERSGSGVDGGFGQASSQSTPGGGGGEWMSPSLDHSSSSSALGSPTAAAGLTTVSGGRSRSPAAAGSKYPWNGFSAPIRGFNRSKQQTPGGGAASSSGVAAAGAGMTTANAWTTPTPFSSSLDFLDAGFRELVRCRQVLRGSFAFSYYTFADDEELDVGGANAAAAAGGGENKILLSRQLLRRHRGR